MKIIKQVKKYDNLNTLFYNILEDEKNVIWLSIATFNVKICSDKAPFQSISTLNKYKKMKDDELMTYIIDYFINKNLI